ncbi:MAG: cadherin-like beta sandwich domain-containing protein [Dysgonamonadaceae bacterium]|nr:cadherin-like beta sandwich domain-containing protein [Dysgonamonadaceae bacterium]
MKKTVILLLAALMLPLCQSIHAQRRSDYRTFEPIIDHLLKLRVSHVRWSTDNSEAAIINLLGYNLDRLDCNNPLILTINPADVGGYLGDPDGTLAFYPRATYGSMSLRDCLTFLVTRSLDIDVYKRKEIKELNQRLATPCSSGGMVCLKVSNFNMLDEELFFDTPALEQAEIGSGVRHLLKGTFRDCKNLKYVKFGPDVIKIDQDCFLGCNSLEVVEFEGDGTHPYFPETIKHMFITNYESSAQYCTNMKAFVVPDHQVSVWKDKLDNVFKPVKDGTCRVMSRTEFYAPYVNGVVLDTSSIILPTDFTYQLTASVLPSNTWNKNVIWSSSNPSVATVSSTGLVTYVSPGAATITAVSEENGWHTASAAVTAFLPYDYVNLKTLSVTGYALSPAFDENTLAYTVTVPFSVQGATLHPAGLPLPSESPNMVTIVPEAIYTQVSVTLGGEKTLSVGDNVFSVVVNSGFSWYANKTYTVTVHRKSNDATLKSLTVGGNTLPLNNPAHSLTVSNAVTSVAVAAEATHSLASVSVSGANALNIGDNTVTVTVTAEDGNTATCTIRVHRNSADATLKSLSAGGTVFSPDNPARSITVPNAVTSVVVTAETTHPLASVSVDGAKPLNVGANTVTVTVTAEDGNTKTYTIQVHRKSNDATLKSFTLNNGDIPFGFNPAILNYTVPVSNSISSIRIAAAANHSLAALSGDTGNKTLNVGDNRFTVTVTPEEGLPKTYTLAVYRRSADDRLQSLMMSSTLDGSNIHMEYNPEKLTYTVPVPVPVSVTNITLNARANHSAAIVTGHTGIQSLRPGRNIFHITVTSEDGTVKTYPVIITVVGNVII